MKRKAEEMNGHDHMSHMSLPDYSQPPPPLGPPPMAPPLPQGLNFSQLQQPPPPPPMSAALVGMNYAAVAAARGGWNQAQVMVARQMYPPPMRQWNMPWRGQQQSRGGQNQRGNYYQQRGRGGPRYGGYQDYYQQGWNQGGYQQQQSAGTHQNGGEAGDSSSSNADGEAKPKDKKRKSMSQSYPSRPWNEEDAKRALLEENNHMKGLRNQSLIIRFPDPELSKDIVKSFHTAIDNVHFQVPSGARYCFVQLSDKVNAEKTIRELEQIKFGAGKLTVEKKFHKDEEDIPPDAIDPYTLYIGNLPTNINVGAVKEKFPTAARIDIGFAQKMKYTRYAFIRYNSVDEAIDAYRTTHNLVLDSRSIIVRFRRQRGHVGMPGEAKPPKVEKEPEKSKVKVKKEKSAKAEDDNEDDEDDDDEDDDDEVDDEDDDDDEEDEDPANDDADEEEDEEEPDDDEEDDDPNDDEDEDCSGGLFQQLESQLGDLSGGSIFNL